MYPMFYRLHKLFCLIQLVIYSVGVLVYDAASIWLAICPEYSNSSVEDISV
uniref:Uncharacterized protein n=1 Tax=Arundo donax TaxID=35708 RepID=A0A0A9FRZ8_ARUDO